MKMRSFICLKQIFDELEYLKSLSQIINLWSWSCFGLQYLGMSWALNFKAICHLQFLLSYRCVHSRTSVCAGELGKQKDILTQGQVSNATTVKNRNSAWRSESFRREKSGPYAKMQFKLFIAGSHIQEPSLLKFSTTSAPDKGQRNRRGGWV